MVKNVAMHGKDLVTRISKLKHSLFKRYKQGRSLRKICSTLRSSSRGVKIFGTHGHVLSKKIFI